MSSYRVSEDLLEEESFVFVWEEKDDPFALDRSSWPGADKGPADADEEGAVGEKEDEPENVALGLISLLPSAPFSGPSVQIDSFLGTMLAFQLGV